MHIDTLWEMVRSIPSPLALMDAAGSLLRVNQPFCALVGREEAVLVEGGMGRVMDPQDLAEDRVQMRRLVAGEIQSYRLHHRLRTAHGGVIPVRCDVWLPGTGRDRPERPAVLRLIQPEAPDDGMANHAAAIVASSGDAITGYSIDGRIIHWNPAAERLYQVPAEEAVGRPIWEVLPREWADDIAKLLERVSTGERIDNYETSRPRNDGTRTEVSLTIAPIVDACDRVIGASFVARDITQRKRAEVMLSNQTRVLESIAAAGSLGQALDSLAELVEAHGTPVRCSVLILDDGPTGRLRHGGGLSLPGIETTPTKDLIDDAPGGPWGTAAMVAADLATDPRWASSRDAVLALGVRTCWSWPIVATVTGQLLGIFALYCGEGRRPDDHDCELLARYTHVAALAIARHRTLTELAHQAIHDPLTGAANRTLVADRLGLVLQRLVRDPSAAAAVLFLDLDRFKALNDSYGHEAGDTVLIELTERLRSAVRPSDTVARLGGDEFVVLCDPILGELEAVGIADRIAQAVSDAFIVDGTDVHLTASIGIAFPRAGDTPDTVLGQADAAMYQAKERGKARFQVFDTAMHGKAVARLHTEQALREALHHDEFKLVYQPLVELEEEHVVGVEALLRWDHPQRGLLAPGAFLAVAEESGLIVPIGTWVINEACRQASQWQAAGHPTSGLQLQINLSARQLSADLPDIVRSALDASRADPSGLCLEITETILMADAPLGLRVLRELKSMGLQLSIDDFGTGYSSLSYVNALPIDQLKIDRSFIQHIHSDGGAPIVLAVVGMAHALELDVVAEGVETRQQLKQLGRIGCDLGQGYYWSRPLEAHDVALLDSHARR